MLFSPLSKSEAALKVGFGSDRKGLVTIACLLSFPSIFSRADWEHEWCALYHREHPNLGCKHEESGKRQENRPTLESQLVQRPETVTHTHTHTHTQTHTHTHTHTHTRALIALLLRELKSRLLLIKGIDCSPSIEKPRS